MNQYARDLVDAAVEMGAEHAVVFAIGDIVFDSRTLLKCMFGCGDWGNGLTCPSARPQVSMADYREMLSRYRWGVIIHGHDKHTTQRISYALEQRCFADGRYFAFSMSDCGLCDSCAGFEDQPCRHPRMARPAFHSVGIDVFATVRAFGLPIDTLREEGQQQNWYAAVFVE